MGQTAQNQGRVETIAPFGDLLRRYRRAAGLTQEELADRAGLSERAIREIERGSRHIPRRETVRLLADALELAGAERTAFEAAVRQGGAPEQFGSSTLPSELHTFLIADVRDYTRFTQEQGDEAAARLAARFAEVVEDEVTGHNGQLLELRGDEAMVVFSSAREAIRAAVELQHRFASEVQRDPSLPLTVGIGLDTGDVVPVKGGYRGGALNLAARLCSLAGAGEVFASEAFVHLARKTEGCVYIDRGEVHLKGLADPVRVIQIAAEGEVLPELPPLEQPLVSPPTNLPDDPTPFIGREREIREVIDLLRQPGVRLVTLTGTGGTGKTRLALQVAGQVLSQFADGVFLVSLAPVSDPQLVPSAIADSVGVKEQQDLSLMEALTASLSSKRLLLVLDNVEHLVEAAPLVAGLLDACRTLHVLVTSRIPLHLAREHEYGVPPLSVPDLDHVPPLEQLFQVEAVALFLDRARAARANFTLTEENARAVAEICSRLDGLPLAIVLAAARIKLFPPQALLQRLSSRLALLTGGARDLPVRQQTLRAAIEWSYDLLTQPEQRLFARLSVFSGGCTLEAAEAVCAGEGDLDADILEGLSSLLGKSLLRQEGDEEPRFVMLETIREYAADRLEANGESAALHRRHAAFFSRFLEEAEQSLWGPDPRVLLAPLDRELDNLRAAMQSAMDLGDTEVGLRIAVSMQHFWEMRGYPSEGRRWLGELLAADEVTGRCTSPTVRGTALLGAGFLADMQGDIADAVTLLEQSLALARDLGEKEQIAVTLGHLGNALLNQGNHARALPLFEESLDLALDSQDEGLIAAALRNRGGLAMAQGELDRATELFEKSLAIYRRLDQRWETAQTLELLAEVARSQGNPRRVIALLEEAVKLSRATGQMAGIPASLMLLAMMARSAGDYRAAESYLEEGVRASREVGNVQGTAFAQMSLGLIAREQGNYDRAIELYNETAAIYRQTGQRHQLAMSLIGLSDVARDQGDADRTEALAEEALHLLDPGGWFHRGYALNNLALAARQRGDHARAGELCAKSIALFRSHAHINPAAISEILVTQGLIACDRGDYRSAQAAFSESLTIFERERAMLFVAQTLEAMAAVAAGQGSMARAATLFGAAEALRSTMQAPVRPCDRPFRDRSEMLATTALGEDRFVVAWEEGQAMTVEQAIEYALHQDVDRETGAPEAV